MAPVRAAIYALTLAGLLSPASASEQGIQEAFETYCVRCHGETLASGKIRLDTVDFRNTELTRRIIRVLTDGVMPPQGTAPAARITTARPDPSKLR